jgi:hypothetical protein
MAKVERDGLAVLENLIFMGTVRGKDLIKRVSQARF